MAVVITYTNPATGTFAPTAAQVQNVNTLTAQVTMGDTDTSAPIVTNFASSAGDLAELFPDVNAYQVTPPGTLMPVLTFALGANTVTMTKVSATGSNGTFNVTVARPHSIIR